MAPDCALSALPLFAFLLSNRPNSLSSLSLFDLLHCGDYSGHYFNPIYYLESGKNLSNVLRFREHIGAVRCAPMNTL